MLFEQGKRGEFVGFVVALGQRDFGGFLGLLGFNDVELEFAGGRDGEVFEVGRGSGGSGGRRGSGGGFREGGGRRGFGCDEGFGDFGAGTARGGFGEGVFGGFGGEGLFASTRADGRGGSVGGEGHSSGDRDAGGGFLLGAGLALFG